MKYPDLIIKVTSSNCCIVRIISLKFAQGNGVIIIPQLLTGMTSVLKVLKLRATGLHGVKYSLKHEQQCFIGFKTRGISRVF